MIKINGSEYRPEYFPDGTLRMNINTMGIMNISWHFENNSEMMTLMFLAKHIREHNPQICMRLFMYYVPNARMDRVKDNEEVFTLKYFTDFINSLDFDEVCVLDTHSAVTDALINNLLHYNVGYIINDMIKELNRGNLMVFYPDEGAMKRYSTLCELSQMPYAFGIKNRDWKTGKISNLDVAGAVEQIADKDILIIDDICSRGGTIYHSAKKLKELGANKIYVYVSHCESSIFYGEIFKSELIEKIFTTDSIFTPVIQEKAKELGLKDKFEVFKL